MADDVGGPSTKKIRMSRESHDELWDTPREDLINRIVRQQQEIDALSLKQAGDTSLDELRETVEKLKLQVTESERQENLMMLRLATKNQEVQELMAQLQELKQAQNPSSAQLQAMMLDPAINLMFLEMKQEVDSFKTKLEQAQNELAAWKFTPDSQTGKRLMAKCRMLLQENEELGKTVSSGRIAKLDGEIAMQKKLALEMKKSESATEEFLTEMDDDLDALQDTVYLLQQELKESRKREEQLEHQLRQVHGDTTHRQDDTNIKTERTDDDDKMDVTDTKAAVTNCGNQDHSDSDDDEISHRNKQQRTNSSTPSTAVANHQFQTNNVDDTKNEANSKKDGKTSKPTPVPATKSRSTEHLRTSPNKSVSGGRHSPEHGGRRDSEGDERMDEIDSYRTASSTPQVKVDMDDQFANGIVTAPVGSNSK